MNHDFRKPIFTRNDDQSEIDVSVVVWDERMGGVSIKFANSNESVLVDAADWERIKAAVDLELNRVA
jgi:hypothetical protein